MQEWMREQGGRVQGHRVELVPGHGTLSASCTCGYGSLPLQRASACLALVLHLEHAVREGAVVLFPRSGESGDEGPDDGSSGVREPRRPMPPYGSGGVGLRPPA